MSLFEPLKASPQEDSPRFVNTRVNSRWFIEKNRNGRGWVLMIDEGIECLCPTLVPYRTYADAVNALVINSKMLEDSGARIEWEVLP